MKWIHRIRKHKKGNVTTLWLGGLPIFILMFLFVGNMVMVWLSHSNSQVAADSGSLAATKKMDHWVKDELHLQMEAIIRQNAGKLPGDPGYLDPYFAILGTDEKKAFFMELVIRHHQQDIASYVRKYVVKSGGEAQGKIIFSPDGRIEVRAETELEALIFKDSLNHIRIKGSGVGPKREYLTWLDKPVTIDY